MSRSRNAKCSCGSGKKYKLCHGRREPKEKPRTSKATVVLALVSAAAMALVGVYTALDSRGNNTDSSGRTWSSEHGHWHDAAGGEPASPSTSGAPPGKVWSPEHNHFH